MEKDEEVKGKGNSYTTFFRYYDSRVARWLSTDPVAKPNLSTYNSMSNNPITRIDPKGDDDYFNSKGKYLHSDSKTTRNIVLVNNKGIQTQLKDYVFKKYNGFVVAKIGRYYADEAGVKLNLSGGCLSVANIESKIYEGQLVNYVTDFFNNGSSGGNDIANYNTDNNTITISLNHGKVNELLNDGNNFKSLLVHEKEHQASDEDNTYEHLDVYLKQVKDKSFKNTTKEWKGLQTQNIKDLFQGLEKADKSNWTNEQVKSLDKYTEKMKKKFIDSGIEL
jgi:RHS repeat-associated protein